MIPDPIRPGQESAWSFPRPAVAQPCSRHIRILVRGRVLADSTRSVRTLETSHPPTYYIPPADIDLTLLRQNRRTSMCEWKGDAAYFNLVAAGHAIGDVAWCYPDPTPPFLAIRGHLAFYAAPFECTVDGERVVPQQGPFYGGWITSHVAGPFKGAPGTSFW